ncbi:ABC transporter ATP-binding protein [Paenibacillus sp. 598K]|uniref:ABC transporter ATP-binding protein n=1 Tax=Paenibacillus sp. 598K TaxID=1117987 RepID=UPI000FFA2C63|nr:ABC transporter ATP-binding protein [Paenibacillus sp. 598K]GBF74950.1 ABC transporter ATP-binding protein [Paenibacillus sp. 598K]
MKTNSDLSRLLQVAGEKKWLLLVASCFSVLSSVLQLVPFVAVYRIVEELLRHAQQPEAIDGALIMRWGWLALGGLGASLIALYIGGMCSHIAAFNILYRLRLRLAEHVSRVPMGYHTKTATGELKKIIETSVEKIESFLAHQLPDTVSALLMPLLLLGYLFWIDWRMAGILLLPLLAAFWLQARVFASEQGKQAYRDYQYALEDMNATGVEYVRGMQAVKLFGLTADSFLTFKHAVTQYRDIALTITRLCKTSYSLFFVLVASLVIFVVPLGIWLMRGTPDNQAMAITFTAFLILAPGLSAPVLKLIYLGGGLREIAEGNRRIEAVLSEPITVEPAMPRRPERFDIVFREVSFAYEHSSSRDYKPVLQGVDFLARAGEMTALVGPSGGGKSTIANLLLRFWDVSQGEIAIGGVPIREMGTERLMRTISFVFQDVHLFYDTIEANLRMGNMEATREEVIAAAKAACCHDFIAKLPLGYDTRIGEGGTYLSGGEAQRISIARALLKNAPILVLDEATAYADAANEYQIQQAIGELVKGKTVIIIAHRLSTIRRAEQILVVRNGRIAERGTHDELRALGGCYEQMWQAHSRSHVWRLGQRGASQAADAEGMQKKEGRYA